MADINDYIHNHLLAPLKQYPTIIQDTLIEIIAQRLEELYKITIAFPEIITPSSNRVDILRAIADQFLFTIRNDAAIEEQVAILEEIIRVYRRRGSIDTIENMWKYYGGKLPKDVKINIPSYNLFRYSVSTLSGTHVFQDNATNRTGVYEIRLTNNTYPIPDLKEFLLDELVAAGNYIYFTNVLHMDMTRGENSNNSYDYLVRKDDLISLQLSVLKSNQGFTWSGHNPLSKKGEDSFLSGREAIYLELSHMLEIPIATTKYVPLDIIMTYSRLTSAIRYPIIIKYRSEKVLNLVSYCTPSESTMSIDRYLYDINGKLIENPSSYPGYFVLGESLLGEEVN